jgi:hypothetical protein
MFDTWSSSHVAFFSSAPRVRGLPNISHFNVYRDLCNGYEFTSKSVCRFLVDTVKLATEVPRGPRTIASVLDIKENPAPLVTKEVIERSVRLLMQEDGGSAVRGNMQKMMTSAHKAVQPGGTSRRNVETYVSLLHMKAAALTRRLEENRPLEKSLPQM